MEFTKLFAKKTVESQYALYLFPTIERRLKRLNELVNKYIKLANKADTAQKNAALEKLIKLHNSQERINELFEKLSASLAPLNDDPAISDEYIRGISPNARYAYFKDALTLKQNIEGQKPLTAPSDTIKKEFAFLLSPILNQ